MMTNILDTSKGSINDITNLKFYTAKGYEIPMLKSYVLTWEVIPGELASKYIKSPIKGYFIGDIDFNTNSSTNELKIKSILALFINLGEIYVRFASKHIYDENRLDTYAYNEVDSNNLLPNMEYYAYLKTVLFDNDNKVKISINVKNTSYTYTFDINDIFELNGTLSTYLDYTTVTTIYTGTNNDINKEFYQYIGISKIDLKPVIIYEEIPNTSSKYPEYQEIRTNTQYILTIFDEAVPNIGVYFPFVRYAGDFYQERVSSGFIAVDTLLVLEEVRNEDDTYSYVKPYITDETGYSLVFLPAAKSEIKLIDKASEYNILYKDDIAFALSNSQLNAFNVAEPFSFSVAFLAEEEGAYQNLLGIYLTHGDNREHVFFMGAISIKSEVEGEDERFRTLLTNFGVPDPMNYSNIFAELDFQEEGKDYKLINKKSKELMLTYDLIFSYVGTYKALFKAIKFLGYQDIVFKEWYNIKDQNDKMTDIAVLVFDSSTGSFLKQKLADYGISIEDFLNYDKLNRISMIYHFNEVSDEDEKIETYLCLYNISTGNISKISDLPRTIITEVPMTKPLYIYRNEEILAKLFAVKQWLEQHIIGVGAYISDITGEGIYFCWQKTLGYSTQHYLNDFSQEQYYTPDHKSTTEFIDSSAIVSCTLNELNNAVRFIDYENTAIGAFDKYDISINLKTEDGTYINSSVLTISNSIESPVLGDEYEFVLINKPNSGTLYEWTSHNDNSLILILDGEIKLLFDKDNESYIDSSCLPIITLENANIHNAYGNWRTNIKWSIRETINGNTGNTQYELKNCKLYLDITTKKIVNQYITITPDSSDAYIKYSEKNKWDIPMFIIHGYKFANIDISTNYVIGKDEYGQDITIDENDYYNLNDSSCDFILEILKGDMLFKTIENCGCLISFSSDLIKNNNIEKQYTTELEIQPIYTYHSDRKAFINLDSSAIYNTAENYLVECISEINNISTNLENALLSTYNTEINNLYSFLAGKRGVAYYELLDFINEREISDTSFINTYIDLYKNMLLDASLTQIINDNYTFNKTIDVSVSRLGQYELVTKAFDKYNNMFTAKYDNKIDVVALPIPIDTIIENEYSNNTLEFYRFNKNGIVSSSTDKLKLLNYCDNKIYYPKTYPIYNIDYNLENDYVEFDNISYAIDTPKLNDIVTFTTLSDRCVRCENTSNGLLKLMMLDENPNKTFLYANTSALKSISLFAYDYIEKNIIPIAENLHVINSSLVNLETDINYEADSYITVECDNVSIKTIITDYIENNKVYVINTTQYPIIPLSKDVSNYNIEYDVDKRISILTFKNDQIFNNEDVIKIRYYMNVSWNKLLTVENYINSDTSISNKKIINETAYRIIDVSHYIDKRIDPSTHDTYYDTIYKYTINGLLNTNLLDSSVVDTYIMYASLYPVKYSSKIMSNAYEFNDLIGFDNYSIIRDHFNFNSARLFLNDYIDDTYGIEIEDYDYINGQKYWFDFKSKYLNKTNDIDLYYYHQFPVSINLGDNIIFKSHNSNNTFKSGYKTDWRILTLSVDELSNLEYNIHTNRKSSLFRSINDILSIKPYMLGAHNIELTCTDIYGNRLVNPGEGLLYVNEIPQKYKKYSYI